MGSSFSSPSTFSSSDFNIPPRTRRVGLTVVMTLFFMWGFITCLNDILIPHLKGVFNLDYTRAVLIQFTFFGAYFLMSLPAGKLVSRLGYQRTIVAGLLTAGVGTLLFLSAADTISYALFLGALFILASGITILQVSANPYVSVLGRPETASSRLNLAQAFCSLGTTLAPWFGGILIFASNGEASKAAEAGAVKMPYLMLTGILVMLAIVIACSHLPKIGTVESEEGQEGSLADVLKIPHLSLGALGIFLYVGAEVSIGSFLISYLGDEQIAGMSVATAAKYVSLYWGGAMVGRFVGSVLLQRLSPERMLAFNAFVNAILSIAGFALTGPSAMWTVLSIGLFNSIMFPNIFTLSIRGLGHLTGRGSSILIMAIVGGAVVPLFMGMLADWVGIRHAMFVPAVCYLYIIFYGARGCRVGLEKNAALSGIPAPISSGETSLQK